MTFSGGLGFGLWHWALHRAFNGPDASPQRSMTQSFSRIRAQNGCDLNGAGATRSVSQAGYGQYGWFGHALFRLALMLVIVSTCKCQPQPVNQQGVP